MDKIEEKINFNDAIKIINNNLEKIYIIILEIKTNTENSQTSKSKSIVSTLEKKLEENIIIKSEKEYIRYSTSIPGLKLGRTIEQEYDYIWKNEQ